MKTQVIKKLIDQVGTDTSGKWIQVDKLPEFAELIVLECAEIADTAEPFLASDLIKHHFGVKE
jgi:hypothetical protein